MPQGLKNAANSFQALMDVILRGIQYKYILGYIDDLIIFSSTFELHLQHLEEVFRRIRGAGLKFKASKAKFAVPQVTFLGHILSDKGISPNPDKASVIGSYPVPKKLKHLRSFIGMCGFYRKHIPNFGLIARPLYDLTKAGVQFVWSKECQEAFDRLKSELSSDNVLTYPNFQKRFILSTDASNVAIAAVLSQEDDHGVVRPVAYAGRSISSAERNYDTTQQELLAVVWGVNHFRVYLEGNEFDIYTDHSALQWILGQKQLQGRLARWALSLQGYSYKVHHIKGKLNIVPYVLSRRPYDTTHTKADDAIANFPDVTAITTPEKSETPKLDDDSSSFDMFGDDVYQCEKHPPYESDLPLPERTTKVSFTSAHSHPSIHKSKQQFPLKSIIKRTSGEIAINHSKRIPIKVECSIFPHDHDNLSSLSFHDDSHHVSAITRSDSRRNRLAPKLQATAKEPFNKSELTPPLVKDEQQKDPQCRSMLHYLKYGKLPNNKSRARSILLREEDYIIFDGMLYHIDSPRRGRPSNARLVVPITLRKNVLPSGSNIFSVRRTTLSHRDRRNECSAPSCSCCETTSRLTRRIGMFISQVLSLL